LINKDSNVEKAIERLRISAEYLGQNDNASTTSQSFAEYQYDFFGTHREKISVACVAVWNHGGDTQRLGEILKIAAICTQEIIYQNKYQGTIEEVVEQLSQIGRKGLSKIVSSMRSDIQKELGAKENFSSDVKIFAPVDFRKYEIKDMVTPLPYVGEKDSKMPVLALLAVLVSIAAFYFSQAKKTREKTPIWPPRGQASPSPAVMPKDSKASGYLLVTWGRTTSVDMAEVRLAANKLTPAMGELVNGCNSFKWMSTTDFDKIKGSLEEVPERGADALEGYLLGMVHDEDGKFRDVGEHFSFDHRQQILELADRTNLPKFDVKMIKTSLLETLEFRTRG